VNVFGRDGDEIKDGGAPLATGMKLKLMDGGKVKQELPVVVKGDVTGTGDISASDARAILRHVAKLSELKGEFLAAADLNGDGSVDASAARMILRFVAKLEKSL